MAGLDMRSDPPRDEDFSPPTPEQFSYDVLVMKSPQNEPDEIGWWRRHGHQLDIPLGPHDGCDLITITREDGWIKVKTPISQMSFPLESV